MNEKLTELVFILDRSGSMAGLEADTIGGFNSMIKKQQEEGEKVIVSTVLFDDNMKVLHDRKPIERIKPITKRDYYVGGCTALLDAVGGAINHIGNVHKYAREEDRPGKTLFVITTDGCENSSKRYTYGQVKKMIERQKNKYNWEFIFLGANIDAAKTAESIGISRERAATYECDKMGTQINFSAISRTIASVAKCSPKSLRESIDECDFAMEIEKYRESKQR